MRKNFWMALVLLMVIPGLLFTASCAKKTVKMEPVVKAAEDEAAKKAAEEAARQAEQEKQRQKALEEQRLREEQLRAEAEKQKAAMAGEKGRFENEHIYFDFDKSNLKPEAQEVLKRKAAYMQKYPNVKVIIEGHCDERGTNEYNLALGDRRANSAKKFLVTLGIAESRLTTISYGEERPLDPGKTEAAWSKNRRCQFVIE